jgi:broad specificity phosphatase PhoE
MEQLADSISASKYDVAQIYTGDLRRQRESANIIAGRLGLEPIVTSLLNEIHYGEAEGMPIDGLSNKQLLKKYGHLFREDVPEVVARARQFLEFIKEQASTHNKVIIAVTSDGFIMGIEAAISGKLNLNSTANAGMRELTF